MDNTVTVAVYARVSGFSTTTTSYRSAHVHKVCVVSAVQTDVT